MNVQLSTLLHGLDGIQEEIKKSLIELILIGRQQRKSGSIGLEALTMGALGNSDAATSSLLAGITGPIFDAGCLRAQIKIQDAVPFL